MNDFLDDRRREISERLKELKPFVDEFNRLEEAASALAGVVGSAASEASDIITRRRGPGRPRGTRARKASAPGADRHATATRTTRTRRKAKRAAAKPKATAPRANRAGPPNVAPGAAKAAARAQPRRCRSCRVSPASRSPSWPRRWGSSRTTSTACSPAWSRKKRWRRKTGAGTRGAERAPSFGAPGAAGPHTRLIPKGAPPSGGAPFCCAHAQTGEPALDDPAGRRTVPSAQIIPAPATVSRSPVSSATEASILERENSLISSPSHDPVLTTRHRCTGSRR